MSAGTKVASLFAEIGFKISERDIESVKQAFNSLKDKIDELVAKTAEFANTITRLSKSTGLSPKLLQDFHKLGIEAGIATDEVDSMLNIMADVANKAYWGLGNQYAQWGLFFGRGETAASALIKTLQKLSISSPQKQREIANELGLQLDAALMLAEKYKNSGLKIDNPFALSEEEVKTMHEVNIETNNLTYNIDAFWKKLTSTQGENQLRNIEIYSKFLRKIQEASLGLAKTSIGNTILDVIVTGASVISPIIEHGGAFLNTLGTTFKVISSGIKLLPLGILTGFVIKLLSLMGIIGKTNFFGSLQSNFDKFLSESGGFGEDLKKAMESAFGYLLNIVNQYIPEIGKTLGITEFLQDAKEGKLFEGIGKLLDRWYSAFIMGISVLINKLKIYGGFLWGIFSNGLKETISWAWDTLKNDVFKNVMLMFYKGLNRIPGVDLTDKIAELEEELATGSPNDLLKNLKEIRNTEVKKLNLALDEEESLYESVRNSLMGGDNDTISSPEEYEKKKEEYKRSKALERKFMQDIARDANEMIKMGLPKSQVEEWVKNAKSLTATPIPSNNSSSLSIDHSGATSKNFDVKIEGYKGSPEELVGCIQDWADSVGMTVDEVARNQEIVKAYCMQGGAGQY